MATNAQGVAAGGTRTDEAPLAALLLRPIHAKTDEAFTVSLEDELLSLISPDGQTSGDPHVLYGDYTPTGPRNHREGKGAIRAFGDHKGSGLALMCELLGGSLTGTGATEPGRKFSNGMLSFYVDPAKIDPSGFFPKDVKRYVDFVKGAKPAKPGDEILVPGEPEERMKADRLANGVPLPDDTWAAIVDAARKTGVDERRIQNALA